MKKENQSFRVSNDIKFSDCNFKNFKYNAYKYLIISDNFKKLLTISRIGSKLNKINYIKSLSYNKLKSNIIYYIDENDFMIKSPIKNKYIKQYHPSNYLVTFTPKSTTDINTIPIICELYDEYRELIKKLSFWLMIKVIIFTIYFIWTLITNEFRESIYIYWPFPDFEVSNWYFLYWISRLSDLIIFYVIPLLIFIISTIIYFNNLKKSNN